MIDVKDIVSLWRTLANTNSSKFVDQNIPRTIWLDQFGGQLVQWPVEEVNRLRKNKVEFSEKVLNKGSVVTVTGITGSQVSANIPKTYIYILKESSK